MKDRLTGSLSSFVFGQPCIPSKSDEPGGSQTADETDCIQDEMDELYCAACDKQFASVNAKLNHESSKKHKKQLELLRKILLSENIDLMNDSDTVKNSDGENDQSSTQPKNEVKLTKRAKKAERKRRKEMNNQENSVHDSEDTAIPSTEDIAVTQEKDGKSMRSGSMDYYLHSSRRYLNLVREC